MTDKTNKHICRGINKETGKFVYGFYFALNQHYVKDRHFIIDPDDSLFIPSSIPNHTCLDAVTRFVEITQEPDSYIKTIDGVDYYENDRVKIPFIYNDYQSSHAGYVDMEFHEIYYKEAIIVFNEESSQYVAEWERKIIYEGGNTGEYTEFTKDGLECTEYNIKEAAEEILAKGEEEGEYMIEDKELEEEIFKNGVNNYKLKIKKIGNAHGILDKPK